MWPDLKTADRRKDGSRSGLKYGDGFFVKFRSRLRCYILFAFEVSGDGLYFIKMLIVPLVVGSVASESPGTDDSVFSANEILAITLAEP